MTRHLAFLWVLGLGLLAGLPAMAQGTPQQEALLSRYRAAERWRGTVEVTRRSTSTFRDPGAYVHAKDAFEEDTARASFVLERSGGKASSAWSSVQSTVTGTHESRREEKGRTYSARHSEKGSYSGPAVPGDLHLRVTMGMDSQAPEWQFTAGGRLAAPYTVHAEGDRTEPGYGPYSEEEQSQDWPHFAVQAPLRGQGAPALEGTFEFRDPPSDDGKEQKTGLILVRVTMTPEVSDFELAVEIPGYEKWLPQGNLEGEGLEAGNGLEVLATVRPRPGHKAVPRVRQFRFELRQTSREPGVCLNWPPLEPEATSFYDMRLAGSEIQDGQVLEIPASPRGQASATVESRDFGGVSDLVVTAELQDGRILSGELKGTRETVIPLPRRKPGSRIAEAWRTEQKCRDEDGADRDAEPEGDGNRGDGFSTYEEYRGFVVAGRHTRTRPGTKDLFVRNRLGSRALPGLARFASLTGLDVHFRLRPDEMPATRRMNANRSEKSPRSTQEYQHGLVLTTTTRGTASRARMRGSLWRPKYCDEVQILSLLLAPDHAGGLEHNIPHELLHALGVHHHGDDEERVTWVRKELDVDGRKQGVFLECETWEEDGTWAYTSKGAKRVRLLEANGQEILPDSPRGHQLDDPWVLWLGLRGQQHSGGADCVMRYCVSFAFIPEGQPDVRRMVDTELVGLALCQDPQGTGFNSRQTPLCRYGDATRGNCTSAFCVRDDAPARK